MCLKVPIQIPDKCVPLSEPTFVALLLHLLEFSCSTRAKAFRVAWLSFALTKVAVFIYTFVMLVHTWKVTPVPFSIFCWVMLPCVAATQVHSVHLLRQITAKANRAKLDDPETGKMRLGLTDAGNKKSDGTVICSPEAHLIFNTESSHNAASNSFLGSDDSCIKNGSDDTTSVMTEEIDRVHSGASFR